MICGLFWKIIFAHKALFSRLSPFIILIYHGVTKNYLGERLVRAKAVLVDVGAVLLHDWKESSSEGPQQILKFQHLKHKDSDF